jgi:HAD superfamily hydrolase (TIGR01549 family)
MMGPVYSIIQDLGFTKSFEQFIKTRDEIYWKWRRHREENHVELPSETWWTEILEALELQFSRAHVTQIILDSHREWRTKISLYPCVQGLLSTLKNDYKIVCISNISEGDLARGDMKILGILDIFDYVVMSSDLGIRKPSPEIFQHVLDTLNITNSEMIFVGDTLYDDVQGAKLAELLMAIHIKRDRSYFFPEYYIKPDKTIRRLSELYNILKSIE